MSKLPRPVFMAQLHAERFTRDFMAYLVENVHVYDAFETEALRIASKGRSRYSARTIVEVLRHESALRGGDGEWNLNDHNTPGLARLFVLMNPQHAGLFEFREVKAVRRERANAC